MPHIIFKQPNNKYGVWSTIVDGPILWNFDKKGILMHEAVTIYDFDQYCKPSVDEAIDEGDIECCLLNGNYEKEELLKFFKDIKYNGPLLQHAKDFDVEKRRVEIEADLC